MKGKWWKEAVCYQVYPASFQDSNGDGIGDIPGVTSRLDYLKSVGVDVIWLSPHYKSPQHDMGYDISDYTDIDPQYGTLDQCQQLIDETHKRGMKIIFDLVVNHTSDEHEWFKESRSSKENPKRDWYIWRPARYDKDGNRQPPNNWRSIFGGSAWEWDEGSEEYYLHLFVKEQPDINWRCKEAREAVFHDAVYFWFKRGVDGFRIDTANLYSKPEHFVDAPIVDPTIPYQDANEYFCNGPEIHNYLQQLGKIFDEYDAMTVGELGSIRHTSEVLKYVGASRHEMSMVFDFSQINVASNPAGFNRHFSIPWKLTKFKDLTAAYQNLIIGNDGWATTFLENHDRPRVISHLGNDSPDHRVQCGKLYTTLYLTGTGTAFIYQGQEIGMINVPKSWPIEEYKDIDAINFYKDQTELHKDDPNIKQKVMAGLQDNGRDNARIPFQWDTSKHAGFSSGTPWMRVHDEYKTINVEVEDKDPGSVLNWTRQTIELRNKHKGLFVYGKFKILDYVNENVFSYLKIDPESDSKYAVVVLNFTDKEQPVPQLEEVDGHDLVMHSVASPGSVLQPFESRVYV